MSMRCGTLVVALALAGALSGSIAGVAGAQSASAPAVIQLTQIPCQFVEPEKGIDRGFRSSSSADCEKANAASGAARVAESEVMRLKPGRYVFRVTNKDVPYELGFWLRESDYDWRNPLHKLSKVSVSGGGLTTGKTQDYEVDLKPGEYFYSCPLNPTPDYRLVVAE